MSWRRWANLDPLEFRLKHLEEERLRNVLEAAAKRFEWASRSKEKKAKCGSWHRVRHR
jgi:hypothetical protein